MASTGEVWRLGRRPALDGVRGLAILLVFVSHAWIPGFTAGGVVGVTVFFTLSGFLITSLLLEEHDRSERVSIREFYKRRARRLLPALVVSTAAVAVVGAFVGSWFFTWRDALGTALYFGNWLQAAGRVSGLGGTWSLAVEEQFYVVWPLVLVFCLRRSRRLLVGVAVVGAVASLVARTVLWFGGASQARVYYGSDMHADALLVGCLLALYLTRARVARSRPLIAFSASVALVPLAGVSSAAGMWAVVPTVTPVLTAALIWAAVAGPASPRWLSWRPLTWLGQRSYGLYLWHCPLSVYMTVAWPFAPWQFRLVVLLAVAVPLTLLSWRYVEQPFSRSRFRVERNPVQGHEHVAAVGRSY